MADGPGDGSSHMRVIVRVRPPNSRERDTNHRLVVQVVDEQMLVLDPKEQAEPSFLQGRQLRQRNMLARKPKDLRFVFDRVFDDTATQEEVFEGSTRSLVEGTLNGFNCTVFAYGATGSGKTHTMLGAPGSPGVMFHTMVSLYRHINDIRDEKRCDVAISYLEVYNEQIRDLLMPSGPLAVHEDPQKGVTVKNLTLHQPQTAEELLQMLERGNLNRTQHPTDANATSSRSHALLQIYVKQQERLAGISQSVRVAKMCLIDLAGSERATVTANRGARFREGANINRSLLALGNCINALADPKNKNQHIPYRNSKLTRLLKDSLGGNCQTIMIAAVSPSSLSLEDTYNTLKYANRAREIKTVLKSNVVSFDCHISRYAKICTELRKEVADLKVKLQVYESGPPPPHTPAAAIVHSAAQTAEHLDRLRSLLGGVLEERRSVRQELLHVDSQLKEMALRSHQRERDQARVCLLCDDHRTVDKATGRLERCTAAARARREHMEERRRAVETRLKDNTERLRARVAEAVLPSDGHDVALSQLLALGVTGMQHEQEAGGLRECLQHAGRLARLHDTDRQHTERLVTALLRVVHKQHGLLASAGLAGAEENADVDEVVRLVRRERAVVWADTAAAGDGDASRDGEGDGGDMEAACDGSVRSAVEFTLPGSIALPGLHAGEAAAAAVCRDRDAPPAGAAPSRLPAPSPPGVPSGSARGRKRQQPTETPARVAAAAAAAAPARTPDAAPAVKRAKRAVLQDPERQHAACGVRGKAPATRRADAESDVEDGVFPLRPELDTSGGYGGGYGGGGGGANFTFAGEGGGRAPLDTTMTLGGDEDDEMDAERGPGGDGLPQLGTGILRRLRLPVLGEAEGNASQSGRSISSSISSSSISSKPGYMALTTAAQCKRMQSSRSVSTSVLRETNHALRDVSAAAQRIPVETQPAKQPLRLFKFSGIGAPPPGAPSALSRSRSMGSLAVPSQGRRKPSSFLFNLQRRSKFGK